MRKIAFITDIHLDEQFPRDNNVDSKKNFETVLADIEKRNIIEVIFGGDIGDPTAHNYFFEKLKHFSLNLILGNHDKFEFVNKYFQKDPTRKQLYYKFELENCQCMFLDTSEEEVSKTQLDWLKDELIQEKELILFIHHPILEIDTAVDKEYPLKNREELKSILLAFKNRITVFCGHYHMNDEQKFKTIRQYTTQSMSYQLKKNASEIEVDNKIFGYRIIEIHNDKIETRIINFDQ